MKQPQIDYWTGCYDAAWKGLLWEDKEAGESAFSHPAKMARGLCQRIIEHALEEGWIQPGQTVLDCFGGVGTTALPCLLHGLSYIGVELEPRFVEFGRKNIALWNSKFSGMPKWTGTAQILQGDSRRLSEVVRAAGIVVGSPPYAGSMEKSGGIDPSKSNHVGGPHSQMNRSDTRYGQSEGQLGAMIVGSPPFGNEPKGAGLNKNERRFEERTNPRQPGEKLNLMDYSRQDSAGNLAALPTGDISAVIGSPPFAGNGGGRGDASRNGIDAALFDRHSGGMKRGTGSDPANLDHLPMGEAPVIVVGSPPFTGVVNHDGGPVQQQGGKLYSDYGQTEGQLGAMIVGSPPFAGSVGSDDPAKRGGILTSDPKRANDVNLTGSYGDAPGQLGAMVVGSPPYEGTHIAPILTGRIGDNPESPWKQTGPDQYGKTTANLGNDTGETFWAASRTILDQCYQILPPGAAAVWVVKNYIKNGKEVDFTGQWAALCEACGFEVVHIHRAMLVKENGSQGDMFGAAKKNKVERKSFFRRLHEAKQKAAKHWETLGRGEQAAALWQAHNELWPRYWANMTLFELSNEEKEKAGIKIDMPAPRRPNRKVILTQALAIAWARDGQPDYEIETSIDWETVLCTVKR